MSCEWTFDHDVICSDLQIRSAVAKCRMWFWDHPNWTSWCLRHGVRLPRLFRWLWPLWRLKCTRDFCLWMWLPCKVASSSSLTSWVIYQRLQGNMNVMCTWRMMTFNNKTPHNIQAAQLLTSMLSGSDQCHQGCLRKRRWPLIGACRSSVAAIFRS